MKPANAETLERKIRQIRADISALIDTRARTVARDSPGVPLGVIRNMLVARSPTCPCAQYLELFSEAQENS